MQPGYNLSLNSLRSAAVHGTDAVRVVESALVVYAKTRVVGGDRRGRCLLGAMAEATQTIPSHFRQHRQMCMQSTMEVIRLMDIIG